jgi:hypothetical protein
MMPPPMIVILMQLELMRNIRKYYAIEGILNIEQGILNVEVGTLFCIQNSLFNIQHSDHLETMRIRIIIGIY